jgi:hypothetical protein
LGVVTYDTVATVVLFRRRTLPRAVAECVQVLVDKHPSDTIYVARDHAEPHAADDVEAWFTRRPGGWCCSLGRRTANVPTR